MLRVPLAPVVASLVLLAACGGSDATAPATIAANTTFTGVFSSGVERGTVTLTAGTPASGTLTLEDEAPVPLTGTFTSATSSFSLAGGGYTVTATPQAEASASIGSDLSIGRPAAPGASFTATAASTPALSGTVIGPRITGLGALSAVVTTTATTSTRYCGVYSGDDAGMGDVLISGSNVAVAISGMGGSGTLSGTASGSTVTASATFTHPNGQKNTLTLRLGLSGTTLSGPASSSMYPNERVNFTASSTACRTTVPSPPYTSYIGYVASYGRAERLSLVPGAPASGTLEWVASTPPHQRVTYGLTGTWNATTGAFNLGYTPPNTVGAPAITVNATATGYSVLGLAVGGLLVSGGQTSLVGAMGTNSALPVQRYCGTMIGGTASAPGSVNGNVILLLAGSRALGVATWTAPGTGVAQALVGSTGGPWVYLAGKTDIFLAGTTTGSGYAGTWSHVNDTKGSFTVTTC